jgi:SAM-dependent methyltransferase
MLLFEIEQIESADMTKCDTCDLEGIFLCKLKDYNFYKCNKCSLIYADVNKIDLDNAYEAEYYRMVYPDYESDRNIHHLNSNMILSEVDKYFKVGRLLEIGSAFGFFLASAANRGWDTTGYEISKYASQIANNKYRNNVLNRDFLTDNTNENYYDVCCLLDTIEHLLNPSFFINKISKALKPGGGLIITTGDVNSMLARLFLKKWRLIDPPLHVHYFSPKSLAFLLEKYGFSIVSIKHLMKYQNLGSILRYLCNIKKSRIMNLPIRINLGDIMTVIARKN